MKPKPLSSLNHLTVPWGMYRAHLSLLGLHRNMQPIFAFSTTIAKRPGAPEGTPALFTSGFPIIRLSETRGLPTLQAPEPRSSTPTCSTVRTGPRRQLFGRPATTPPEWVGIVLIEAYGDGLGEHVLGYTFGILGSEASLFLHGILLQHILGEILH